MKKFLSVVALAAFLCSIASIGYSQNGKATNSPNGKQLETKANVDRQASCPNGGPGLGLGKGPAWARDGQGGAGFGPGAGRGMGKGMGMGMGKGKGHGMGMGMGNGYRHGANQGGGGGQGKFIDENNDGVCDLQQSLQATQK